VNKKDVSHTPCVGESSEENVDLCWPRVTVRCDLHTVTGGRLQVLDCMYCLKTR